uniref:Uncharacterized protein n=1 Tax=Marseillevirus LCMAC103 TaxID=2506604 RepID=A0A481YVE0_9VIRU|nr:MAG: uncharacterized protein LCMAC103_02050 [Marseillevirus LCMAC103]
MAHFRQHIDRQLDHTLLNPEVFTLPKSTKGRFTEWDQVHFHWPASVDPRMYTVVAEALDSEDRFRSIGTLATVLELPYVHFGPYATLSVLPQDARHPAFYAFLVRGGTYILPDTHGQTGQFEMAQHGIRS